MQYDLIFISRTYDLFKFSFAYLQFYVIFFEKKNVKHTTVQT